MDNVDHIGGNLVLTAEAKCWSCGAGLYAVDHFEPTATAQQILDWLALTRTKLLDKHDEDCPEKQIANQLMTGPRMAINNVGAESL